MTSRGLFARTWIAAREGERVFRGEERSSTQLRERISYIAQTGSLIVFGEKGNVSVEIGGAEKGPYAYVQGSKSALRGLLVAACLYSQAIRRVLG